MQNRFLNLLVLFLLQDQIQGFAPAKFGAFVRPNSAKLFAGTLIGSGDLANKTTTVVDKVVANVEDKKKVGKKKADKKGKTLDKDEDPVVISDDLIAKDDVLDEQTILDIDMMKKAIQLAQSR